MDLMSSIGTGGERNVQIILIVWVEGLLKTKMSMDGNGARDQNGRWVGG